jgi:type IV pilus assembly protein PilB
VSFVTGLRVNPILASDEDLDDAISRHLDGRALRAAAFTSRSDAIDLPVDTNPLSVLRRGDFGDPTLH